MTKLKEAAQVSINLHNEIDSYKLPQDIRIKHNAIGQLLRSLLTALEDERVRPDDISTAT
jgi:hypothetical protein